MRYPSPLVEGTLLRRRVRFFADVRLDDGTEVVSLCLNTGSLRGVIAPGQRVRLSRDPRPGRKYPWTWEHARVGRTWVGVMPNESSALIGLSKYARLVEWVMTRPQIQEEAIAYLADLLQEKMQPDGLAIVIEADHYCMQWRGVKDMNSKMTNSIMRGAFLKNPNLRREFLALLPGRQG